MIEDQARLALLESNWSTALELARECYDAVHSVSHPPHWQIRDAITLLAEVLLHRDEEPIADHILSELEALYLHDRPDLNPDRTAAVLALALERNGRGDEADHLIATYLTNRRRSLAPWRTPTELVGVSARSA
jgi:hypothetical protein